MEVILLPTRARRAILAGENLPAASFATLMDRIRCGNAPGLSRVFCGSLGRLFTPTLQAISDLI
jgi:hypothetical protein